MADRNGYIGRAPGDSSVTVARQTFSPTGITTDFTFESGYTPGYFDIFINGAKMIEGSDYTSTDGSTFVILNGGAISGDVIEGVAYKAFNAATATIGISSAGTPISTQANTLNFVGTGNTFALRGSTIDVSISAGAGGTWSNYDGVLGVTTSKKVKISNNLEVTGVTTSTGGFVGNVTGNATGITGTPDITVRNITGVAATFTGVLTYEDVTNIDSVGIITARSDVSIADKIIHTGDTNTAIRFPAADTFTVETAGSEAFRITSGGEVVVNGTATGSNAKFEVQSTTGSISSATLRVSAEKTTTGAINTGSTILLAGHDGGNSRDFGSIFAGKENGTGSNYAAYLAFGTRANGSSVAEKLRITSAGNVSIQNDSGKFTAGAGDDLQIYHNGSDSFIKDAGTGDLIIQANNLRLSNTSGTNYLYGTSSAEVSLYHNGNVKLATSSTGVSVTGGATFTNDVKLGDFSTSGTSTTGCFLQNEGIIYVQRVANSSEGVLRVYAGTSVNVKIDANGDSVFGSTNAVSASGFGVEIDIAANAGTVIAQCQNTASQYTELYKGFWGTTKCFSVAANGALAITGALSKGSGSFKIDHPLPAKTGTHHLVHSFIEGPQADLIYRGYVDLVDGQATVNIDTAARMTEGTFEVLCTNVSCFTSNESDWTAVKGSVTGNVLTITAQDATSTSKVSWMVVGERKDDHMIDTDWTDSNGRVITEPLKDG